MSFTRATSALGLAAAALAMAAPLAAADESGLEINGNQPAQRGTDIRVSAAEDPFTFADEDGFITLESAAFVKPVKIKEGRRRPRPRQPTTAAAAL